ncbi:MAG: hypothetical protein D6768_06240, partial [Chloroflexi bacterium]
MPATRRAKKASPKLKYGSCLAWLFIGGLVCANVATFFTLWTLIGAQKLVASASEAYQALPTVLPTEAPVVLLPQPTATQPPTPTATP